MKINIGGTVSHYSTSLHSVSVELRRLITHYAENWQWNAALTRRERETYALRCMGLTFNEISRRHNCCGARSRQLFIRAQAKLLVKDVRQLFVDMQRGLRAQSTER